MIGVVTGLAAEARIGARLGTPIAGGGTPQGAARAAESLVAQGATALISFGLAGGLNPALPPGTLVIPAELIADGMIYATDPALTDRLGGPMHSLYAGLSVAVTAAEKRHLFTTTRADAIDLESASVAEVAVEHGVRFAVLRAICDPATSTLPPAALIALDQAGAIGFGRVALSVLQDPMQLGALWRLARDAATARSALVSHLNTVRI
jgi:adenosylhomocysteine nucleosidase